ncbi:MAG: mechanosensitive ion channel family protein [Candidatus Kapabacteria bacterium]|jgi:small-conductance mechanosensitive channel/CRP-like cAMP-binding protein|nr:mechanosensitive ion channel family protein [Candidatus Kapabacteria bacterium]
MTNELLLWVVIIGVGFPALIVALTEMRSRITQESATQFLRLTVNTLVPLLALWALVEKVFGVPRDNTFAKIIETFAYVSMMNIGFLGLNIILFSGKESKRPSKVLLDFVRFVFILIGTGFVLALVWDIDLRGVVTTLGVGSIIIGFALQDTLGSLVSGLITLMRRPFAVGDKVVIADMEGEVQDMTWNSVVLRRRDNALAILPQSIVAKQTVVNLTRATGAEHTEVLLDFAKKHAPNTVKRVLMATALSTPDILHEPKPTVRVYDHYDVNLRYSVRFWSPQTISPMEVRDQFLSRLWYVAKRYNFECALPTRRVIQTPPNEEPELLSYRSELASVPLFFKMGTDVLEIVANGAMLHTYGAGEALIREGEMVRALHVIVQGEGVATASDEKGRKHDVFTLRSGDFCGEASLFSARPSPFTITATHDITAVLLNKQMLDTLVAKETALVKEIGRVISERRAKMKEVLGISDQSSAVPSQVAESFRSQAQIQAQAQAILLETLQPKR